MTFLEIKQRVREIEEMASDDEAAHSAEDSLRHDFIVLVAKGTGNLAEMAKEVLKTSDIDFNRWCA